MGKCCFNSCWLSIDAYSSWIISTSDKHKARCQLCKKDLDISQMGEAALKSHMNGKKHQNLLIQKNNQIKINKFLDIPPPAAAAAENANTNKISENRESSITSYVTGNDVLDAEIKWAMKCVHSHYSFKSCEGISTFFKNLFPDSNIAKQFTCGATKCAYMVCFGIAPYFKAAIFKCLDEVDEYCLLFDEALNHTTQLKQLDLHLRYWDSNESKVKTRYFDSLFLGHSTAEEMLFTIKNSVEKVNLSKLLHLSMDGPAVNWKMFTLLQKEIEKEYGTKLLNVGSCGLHTIHNCFKKASNTTNWDIDTFLMSLYWLFKDSPARRDDYLKLSNSLKMPKHFCRHRWLENGPATERALEIWGDLKIFVKMVDKGKITKPTSKSFQVVAQACHDALMPVKLNFFLSVIKILQPFLIKYQSDSPLIPFLADDIKKLVLDCLQTFNVMKKEMFDSIKTQYKLILFDFSDKNCYTDISSVSLGFVGNKELKEIKKSNSISDKQIMNLKHECQEFIYKLVEGMISKTPIQFALVRHLSCLDPRKMVLESHGCYVKIKKILTILADAKKVDAQDCDTLLLNFQEFLNDVVISHNTEFEMFDSSTCRLDTFFDSHLNGNKKYHNIWIIIKKLLIISHGQASVERGFSLNKQIEVENLEEASFVAKRLIIDEINFCGGIQNVIITKELRSAVSGARQKYIAHLEEEKGKKIREQKKRKQSLDDFNALKAKRAHLELSVNNLNASADKLSEKAENTGNIQFVVQSNSFRRSAKEKLQEIKDIDSSITAMLKEMKK